MDDGPQPMAHAAGPRLRPNGGTSDNTTSWLLQPLVQPNASKFSALKPILNVQNQLRTCTCQPSIVSAAILIISGVGCLGRPTVRCGTKPERKPRMLGHEMIYTMVLHFFTRCAFEVACGMLQTVAAMQQTADTCSWRTGRLCCRQGCAASTCNRAFPAFCRHSVGNASVAHLQQHGAQLVQRCPRRCRVGFQALCQNSGQKLAKLHHKRLVLAAGACEVTF